jgi:hypothetical protein
VAKVWFEQMHGAHGGSSMPPLRIRRRAIPLDTVCLMAHRLNPSLPAHPLVSLTAPDALTRSTRSPRWPS